MSERNPSPVEQRRAQRSEARKLQTHREFVKRLHAEGAFPTEELAERAAVAVLCALERRIDTDEMKDLGAQLPEKLMDLVRRCGAHQAELPRRIGPDQFVQLVAQDLGADVSQAVPLIRSVLLTLRDQVSEGEWDEVMRELPRDYHAFFQLPV